MYGFGNPEKALGTLGAFRAKLRWGSTEEEATVVVMKGGEHQNLVGRSSAVAFGDVEIKLEVDETIKPVKQPLRPIAFHYREAVERELDRQVAEGILEKVEFGTKPIT